MPDTKINYQSHSDVKDLTGAYDRNDKAWWSYEYNPDMENGELLNALKIKAQSMINDMGTFYDWADYYNWQYETRIYEGYDNQNLLDDKNSLRQSWNVTRVAVDAHRNRVARVSPKITFLGKDAGMNITNIAQQADDWLFNVYKRGEKEDVSIDCYSDALISGLGIEKICPKRKDETFKFRRVMPYAIGFEKPYEGDTSRDEIVEFGFFKMYDVIDMVKRSSIPNKDYIIKSLEVSSQDKDREHMCKLYEMYKKGRKCAVFTDTCIIKYENWDFDFLPYNIYRWDKKQTGIIGTSVAEICSPGQRKINALLYRIDMNTKYFTNQYVIFPKNSGFQKMSNGFGKYYEANMQLGDPKHITPPMINDQVIVHLRDTYDMTLRSARVSELQSDGAMPKGLSQPTGIGLQRYNDIDNSRFYINIKNYEKTFLDTAKKCIQWSCKDFKSQMFKDIKKHKKEFLNKVNKFPESLLPESPTGRYAILSDMVRMQMMPPEAAMDLLEAPDTSGYLRTKTAATNTIKKMLETAFIEKEEYVNPDPVLDYEIQRQIALEIYARIAKDSPDGNDDERLDNVRDFLAEIKAEMDKIKMEQADFLAKGGKFGGDVPSGSSPAPSNATSGAAQNPSKGLIPPST